MDDPDFELTVEPLHRDYATDDDRFGPLVADLTGGLKDEGVEGVSTRTTAQPGKKGGAAEIILALGSSGMIGACLMAFKAWLDRDKARAVKIKVRDNKTKREVEITADAANLRELEKVLR